MNSKNIPQAAQRLQQFMTELENLKANLPHLKQLCNDWKEIKVFLDAVFYPIEVLNHAEKRNEMELDCEAQEEVDYLLWELGIQVSDK